VNERSKVANVKSMMGQNAVKPIRRELNEGQSMVPSQKKQEGSKQLRAANDSVSLADRARAHPRSKNRAMVDAMRQLRTKLYSLKPEGNFSVLISSVVPEGGGSFLGLNLAATIAFDKARTAMLVEANLHTPILHKLMKLIGRYKQFMLDITERYDNRFVIVDGPSMTTSADARILSEICDFTVLVVPYGGVTPGTLDAVIDEIDERRLAGIVINNQPV